MARIITTLLFCVLCCSHISAQEKFPENMIFDLDVNGVMMGTHMTKEQVFAEFGTPCEYNLSEYSDRDNIYERYFYPLNWLVFVDDSLYSFGISDINWSILNNHFQGGVKVGDNISKLAQFNPEPATWLGENSYAICCYGDFYMTIKTKPDGIIKHIHFTFRD